MRADRLAAIIGLVLIACCVPVFIANIPRVMDAAPVLIVNDKPEPVAVAEEAAEEAETCAEEPEQAVETYAEPVYTYTNNYWYESDDEAANRDAKEWIARRESGGDYDAMSGQYIGRYQLSADKLDGDYSPEHQEEVADAYVLERYGSWEAARDFWQRNGWY